VVEVPASYDPREPVPLVLVLHGYASSGDGMRRYLGVDDLAEERGFLVVHPDGSVDVRGNRFWDATDGCCNVTGTPTGDDEFLARIITEVSAEYAVDPRRVHVVGYSNGGFMAYRMACRHADLVASAASISGATFADPSDCHPSEPVSVLQVHGDADRTIRYDGGSFPGPYPGALETVTTWAGYDGCETSPAEGEPRDLDGSVDGAESAATTFPGCPDGVAVELWTVPGAGHLVRVSADFPVDVIDWLLDHPDEAA
jgi:polyhydroxybutyrate depolymerase